MSESGSHGDAESQSFQAMEGTDGSKVLTFANSTVSSGYRSKNSCLAILRVVRFRWGWVRVWVLGQGQGQGQGQG